MKIRIFTIKISQAPIIIDENKTLRNHKANNHKAPVIQKVNGKKIYIKRDRNVTNFILDANSIIAKCFAFVSSNIASWIIVSSRWVAGLSKGNLLFSARII